MEQLVCILVWIGFFIIGLSLFGFFHMIIPVYLASKIIKILLANSPIVAWPNAGWQYNVAFIGLMVPLMVLLFYLGMDVTLQIPTWAPWAPKNVYRLYHEFTPTLFIAAFVSQFTIGLYSTWKVKRKK